MGETGETEQAMAAPAPRDEVRAELIPAHQRDRRQVVLSFPLGAAALERLVELVGTGTELVDIRDADGSEELVVSPPVSRQLVGRLRQAFPAATVLVVELEDLAHRIDFSGPVIRSLDWGADGYYVARSLEQLATFLRTADREEAHQHVPAALPSAEDELSEIIDAILADRARARAEADRPSP